MLKPPAIESKPLDYSGQRIINGFIRPTDGTSPGIVMGASGVLPFVTLSTGNPVREVIDHSGTLHAICNGSLYSISGDTATNLASIADGATEMATSGTELAIVANETFYLWDGTTLTTPTTGEVSTPRSVTYLDGYFIVSGSDGTRADTFAISGLNDGGTFQGLDFATAENSPDAIIAAVADHGQLWLFGSKTTEVWYNSGNADFPFAPNAGAIVQQGCKLAATVAQLDNSLFWVSPDNTVLRSAGGSPSVISTPEIGQALEASTITGGMAFFDKTHLIYAITRGNDTTLCYDVVSQKWAERAQGAFSVDPWTPCCSANVDGTQYLGTSNGKIAKLNGDTFTDDGEVMALDIISSPIARARPFSVRRIYAQIAGGRIDIGRTPQVLLRTSQDGVTWTQGRYRPMSKQGQHMNSVSWSGLGRFNNAFWGRLTITDPVRRDIHGIDYE